MKYFNACWMLCLSAKMNMQYSSAYFSYCDQVSSRYNPSDSNPNNRNCSKVYHFMMASSNGNIAALLALCHRLIPQQGTMTRSFDVFFYLRLNKRLSKQSRRQWFDMQSRSLWRHCNVIRRYRKYQLSGLFSNINTNHLSIFHIFHLPFTSL